MIQKNRKTPHTHYEMLSSFSQLHTWTNSYDDYFHLFYKCNLLRWFFVFHSNWISPTCTKLNKILTITFRTKWYLLFLFLALCSRLVHSATTLFYMIEVTHLHKCSVVLTWKLNIRFWLTRRMNFWTKMINSRAILWIQPSI